MKNPNHNIQQNNPGTRDPKDLKITGMLMVSEDLSRLSHSYEQTILSAKEAIITAITRHKKELINVAAYTHDENATHLFLVLHNNEEETRDVFYDYLREIEQNKVFVRFPIIFHFISKDMLKDVYNAKQISLDE